jgi:predicted alpha-1,2-mannosidase
MNMNMAHADPKNAVGRPGGSTLRVAATMIWGMTAIIGFAQQTNPARDLVNPFIGTGGHGHTFPGACVPNGLVQLSPDTRPDGYMDWDGCGGYHYSDSLIYGFSHTHLSGTGVADLCDVLITPVAGIGTYDPLVYRSSFRKETERAHAGYYAVHLDDSDVDAELTSSMRVGVHRYSFHRSDTVSLVIDLTHRDNLQEATCVRVSDTEFVGERSSSSWARSQRLFYCVRLSQPSIAQRMIHQKTTHGSVPKNPKAVLLFKRTDAPLIVKVGISAVSIEGARANLEAEVPHWDFDLVRKQAEAAWNAKLGKITVEGGTREEQRAFYTALYHSYVAPYIFNDVDGQYRGMDGQVHTADHNVYTVFSLWDTFRALHPLMTVLEPDMTRDWIKTFLLHYQQGGRLPVWELWGNETECMIGYHSVSVIADAYAKGIRGFDTKLALEAMVASAEADHFGLKAYRERGYISSEDEPESVSRTLEYAYDDWCIARFAEMIGEPEVAQRFFARSRNWQNLFDPATEFFRARRNGGFVEPFDPYEVNFHFTEANAWQYGLFVPHDLPRYLELIGGRRGLTERLDALFTARDRTTGRDQSDITGLIGQYAHGNEPSHNFAYLYALSDRPLSTEVYLRKIMTEFYRDTPDGLIGNEDCGQMSAWFVWSAMGLYPLTPGDPSYVIGTPLFDRVTMDLGQGRQLRVEALVGGGQRDHLEALTWNDRETSPYRQLAHTALEQGGTLRFQLGPRAGSAPVLEALTEGRVSTGPPPAPFISAPSVTFTDSLVVQVGSVPGPWKVMIEAGDLGQLRARNAPQVKGYRVVLRQSCTVTAWCEAPDGTRGPMVTARFKQMDGTRTMTLESTYANQYAAGGTQALVDGLRGGNDFRTGEWQGFLDQDVLATIDLGKVMKVGRIALSALQDEKSWIWLPADVEIVTSINQRQWSSTTVTHDVDRRTKGPILRELWTPKLDRRVRYIKIIARNAGPCPEWHPGKGGKSWIFVDEVLVEPGK